MIGTPVWPEGKAGRIVKRAGRRTGLTQPVKGRISNRKLNFMTKEWTGKVVSGLKRKVEGVEGTSSTPVTPTTGTVWATVWVEVVEVEEGWAT